MKKILLTLAGMVCVLALTVNAAEGKKHQKLTDEQKAFQKEMLEKYDANKDGKIDKDEKAKMSKEDKQKWQETFGHKADKAKGEKAKDDTAK
jgi:hypothetical protein